MKKLTIAENCLKYGIGAYNIDACRIGHNEDLSVIREGNKKLDTCGQGWGFKSLSRGNEGRFPTNFILSHTADCQLLGVVEDTRSDDEGTGGTMKETTKVAKWNCSPNCPCKLLDGQSAIVKKGTWNQTDGARTFNNNGKKTNYKTVQKLVEPPGGASRFFMQIDIEEDK